MRISRSFDTDDSASVHNFVATRIQESLAREDESIVLFVGTICREAALESPEAPVLCCDILDSDAFARANGIWYHHRTGAWGSELFNFL